MRRCRVCGQHTHGVTLVFETRTMTKIPVDGFFAVEYGGISRPLAGGGAAAPFVLLCNVCVARAPLARARARGLTPCIA